MKLNDEWDLRRDSYQWIVSEWKSGTNRKTGRPTRTKRDTYHSSLAQALGYVVDKSAGACETVEELQAHVVNATRELCYRACVKEVTRWTPAP